MSKRIPGLSQDQMIALWKAFVQTAFRKTGFKTNFNGKIRNVFKDAKYLIVLDEWHGDLELLAMQNKAGPAKHVGSQEIDILSTTPSPQLKRGKVTMRSKHNFVLTGSM